MTLFDFEDVARAMAEKAGPDFESCIKQAPDAIRLALDQIAAVTEEAESEQRQLLDRAEEAEHKLTLIADHLDEAHRMLNRMLASGARPTKAALLLALAQVNHARDKANEG